MKKMQNKKSVRKTSSRKKNSKKLSKKKLREQIIKLQFDKFAKMFEDAEEFSRRLYDKKKEFEALNKEAWEEQRRRLTEASPTKEKEKEKPKNNVCDIRAEACLRKLLEIITSQESASYRLRNAYEYLEDCFSPLPELVPNMLIEVCSPTNQK